MIFTLGYLRMTFQVILKIEELCKASKINPLWGFAVILNGLSAFWLSADG